jgi:hypothetical protein
VVAPEGDSEGGQGPGGVASVAAEGGGEVDRPGVAERADGEVAQAGHDLRGSPLRIWEPSSAKVTSRTQCRLFSICQAGCAYGM